MSLVQRKNSNTGRLEWALVSKATRRVLRWFGIKKPTKKRVGRAEAQIQFFKSRR